MLKVRTLNAAGSPQRQEITRRRSLKRERGVNEGSDDEGSDDGSPPLRVFNYKDRNGGQQVPCLTVTCQI